MNMEFTYNRIFLRILELVSFCSVPNNFSLWGLSPEADHISKNANIFKKFQSRKVALRIF